jgi:hypothetical protein
MSRPAPMQFSSASARSQEVLALQHVYAIDAHEHFCRKQALSVLPRSFSEQPTLLMQRRLTCVNIETSSGASQFPIWG